MYRGIYRAVQMAVKERNSCGRRLKLGNLGMGEYKKYGDIEKEAFV